MSLVVRVGSGGGESSLPNDQLLMLLLSTGGGVIACSSGPLGFVTTCCQQRQEDVLTAFIVVVQRGIIHMGSPPHRFRRKEKIDSAYTQSNVVSHLTRAVFCANEERRKQTASAME